VTNFGALSILALPRKPGPGEAAELRLLIALETINANGLGERRASISLVAELAGLPYHTARRARDRLVSAGVIAHERGHRGHGGAWRFKVELAPALSGRESEQSATARVGAIPGDEPTSAHPERARLNHGSAPTSARISAHLDPSRALSTTNDTSLSSTADRARDDDAQPDWQRGPGQRVLSGKVYAPGHGPGRDTRPTPTPPTWTAPRSNPAPEIAHRGAALAKAALAGRTRPEGAPPPPPRTEDERRALARRQVREAARRREADRMTEPAEHRPPERDLGDPPTPPAPDDEPVIFEPETGEGPPDECPF